MAGNKSGGIAGTVLEFVMPYAAELGLSVWDVRYVKEGGEWFLRIFIDKTGGVGIDDCEKMSRAINDPLDELDPVKEPYCLEVSSPGINRELVREEHFKAYTGSPVAVKLIRPASDGKRKITGVLSGYDGGVITVTDALGKSVSFAQKDTAWVKLMEDNFLEEIEES